MNKVFKITFLLISSYFLSCNNLNLDSYSYSRIEINGPEDKFFSNEIKTYKDSLLINLDEIIGSSLELYTKKDYKSRKFNSSLGNLIADIIFVESDSIFKTQENKNIDFVIQNHGGIRASLQKGDIKLTDAYKILPFENEIVIVEMDGKSIYEIVSFLKNEIIPHPFSGLIINNKEILIQKKPIIPSNKYYIAINDYLLNGGDNMFFFNNNTRIYRLGYTLRDAFINYTKSNLYISSKIDDRFIKDE